MAAKITISIDDRALEFLKQATDNRSAYINQLLLEKELEQLKEKLRQAYREQNQAIKINYTKKEDCLLIKLDPLMLLDSNQSLVL